MAEYSFDDRGHRGIPPRAAFYTRCFVYLDMPLAAHKSEQGANCAPVRHSPDLAISAENF